MEKIISLNTARGEGDGEEFSVFAAELHVIRAPSPFTIIMPDGERVPVYGPGTYKRRDCQPIRGDVYVENEAGSGEAVLWWSSTYGAETGPGKAEGAAEWLTAAHLMPSPGTGTAVMEDASGSASGGLLSLSGNTASGTGAVDGYVRSYVQCSAGTTASTKAYNTYMNLHAPIEAIFSADPIHAVPFARPDRSWRVRSGVSISTLVGAVGDLGPSAAFGFLASGGNYHPTGPSVGPAVALFARAGVPNWLFEIHGYKAADTGMAERYVQVDTGVLVDPDAANGRREVVAEIVVGWRGGVAYAECWLNGNLVAEQVGTVAPLLVAAGQSVSAVGFHTWRPRNNGSDSIILAYGMHGGLTFEMKG